MPDKTLDQQSGFTLVELLIVVIILAILAAIVVPQFSASTDDAKAAALDSNLGALRQSINFYYQQHGEYPGANTANSDGSCTGTSVTGAAAQSEAAVIAQLTQYTDENGLACSRSVANYIYGPYLREVPANPITESATIAVATTGDLNLTADGGASDGWKMDITSGAVIANN